MDNLTKAFMVKPKILHFSGHGEKGKGDNDLLIIEEESLEGKDLSSQAVKKLLIDEEREDEQIELAVILSCHSQMIGEIFKSWGVKHVVWIKREKEVQDITWLVFAKAFYTYLLYGANYSIWDSFREGKKAVKDKIGKNEDKKFILLSNHQEKSDKCSDFFELEEGEPKNKSVMIKIDALPQR